VVAIELTAEQAAALQVLQEVAHNRGRAVLMGPAGSGKSTVMACLLQGLDPRRVLLVAPSHKALRVLRQMLSREGVTEPRLVTLASILRQRPRLSRVTGKVEFGSAARPDELLDGVALKDQPPPQLLVLDELSMVSRLQMTQLLALSRALGGISVVGCGDPAQLPPPTKGSYSALAGQELERTGFKVLRLETVQRCGGGPVLDLSVAMRRANHPRQVWPRQSQRDQTSQVVVHRSVSSWLDAAAEVVNTEEWSDDPDQARLISWRHQTASRIGAALRRRRWGDQVGRWHPGEVLLAHRGVSQPGTPLEHPLTHSSAELRLVSVPPVETLQQHLGQVEWFTPARGGRRVIEIAATTQASQATAIDLANGRTIQFWLESPDAENPWDRQVAALRRLIQKKLEDRDSDRFESLRLLASLDSFVPTVRAGSAISCHSSQGSSYRQVYLAPDIFWAGDEASSLAYVGVSRASQAVHLLDSSVPFEIS
jgi:exodeoxyribonuclease-5